MDLHQIRPNWVEIDLDAIKHNVRELSRFVPHARFMAIVKADGYGHGALPVAQAALSAGASWLGVATLEEGEELRQAGITAPILILGYVPPDQADRLVLGDLRPALFDLSLAKALSEQAQAVHQNARVHLKLDTGMSRIGVEPHEIVAFAKAVAALPGVEIEGIFTHLAMADDPGNTYTAQQIAAFEQALSDLAQVGLKPPICHACNSAAILLNPEAQHDLVRAGIVLYGLEPDPEVHWPVELHPVLSWHVRVSMVKRVPAGTAISYGCTYHSSGEEQIATLPVGYADGYARLLSNKGEVLIHGRRCPVVGRVCMDQMMVRVPSEVTVHPGDEAVLIGEQGGERITVNELAKKIGTINYELVCNISKRVTRLYRVDGLLKD